MSKVKILSEGVENMKKDNCILSTVKLRTWTSNHALSDRVSWVAFTYSLLKRCLIESPNQFSLSTNAILSGRMINFLYNRCRPANIQSYTLIEISLIYMYIFSIAWSKSNMLKRPFYIFHLITFHHHILVCLTHKPVIGCFLPMGCVR